MPYSPHLAVYCMSLSILYVMLHVTFHHQQNHNVHVHGKVTVTAVSVQNICALSLRNARISRELAHAIASSSGQQSAQQENSFYRLQRPARPEQPASPLQVAGSCCSWPAASVTRNPAHWHSRNAATATLQFITSMSKNH